MADVIAFPSGCDREGHFTEVRSLGSGAGLTVRLIERQGWPHDLLVVLGGTVEGSSTVAAVPAGELALADVIGHAVLASLQAAEVSQATGQG